MNLGRGRSSDKKTGLGRERELGESRKSPFAPSRAISSSSRLGAGVMFVEAAAIERGWIKIVF